MRQLASTLPDFPLLQQASKIVIGLGINDLLQQTDVAVSMAKLISELQCCQRNVWFLGLLPVNEKRLNRPGLNQQVLELNQQLRLATIRAGMQYIDIYQMFANQHGQLDNNFDLGDGLHLNQNGYQLLIRQLTNSLAEHQALTHLQPKHDALNQKDVDEN